MQTFIPADRLLLPDQSATKTNLSSLYVAGIGINAGDAVQLIAVLSSLPAIDSLCFIVIQEIVNGQELCVSQKLPDHLPLHIQPVTGSHLIQPGTVLIVPPGKNFYLDNERLHAGNETAASFSPFNHLLTILAINYGKRAIALPLGIADAGIQALTHFKNQGGLIIAAQAGSINQSMHPAVPGFMADQVIQLQELPALLMEYTRHGKLISPSLEPMNEKEPNLLSLIENVDGLLWSIDRNMHFIILNKSMQKGIKEMLGIEIKAGDAVPELLKHLDKEQQQKWNNIYREAFEGKNQRQVHKVVVQGRTFHIDLSINPIRHGDIITGLSCFAQDVTSNVANEQRLQESETRFRSLIENSTDIIALVNAEGKVIYGSPSIEKLFGSLSDEYLGISAFNFIHPEEIANLLVQFIELLLQPGVPIPVKTRAIKPDKETMWVEGIVTNLLYQEGINAIVCNFRDVTERVKAEQALQESERRFRLLIENSTDLIIMANAQGECIYGSSSIEKFMGYNETDYLYQSFFNFIHPDSVPTAHQLLQNLLEYPDQPFAIFLKMIHKNGAVLWVEGVASNLLHKPGMNALVANFRDVTERKKAEQQLRESEDLYKNLFNKSPQPKWVCDAGSFRFMEVNDAAIKHYGYSRMEFLNMSVFDIIPPEDYNELKQLLSPGNTTIRQGVLRKHIKKNQEICYVEVLAHLINYKGQYSYLILVHDITEKIRLQNQLMEEKIFRQREITKATIDAQEKEREEIGRELHDNVTQILTTARLCLSCANDATHVNIDMIRRSSDIIASAIEEIRKLSKTLIQSYHKEIGLQLSIEDLVESIRLANKFQINLQVAVPHEQRLDDKLKMNLFRIVQEQLNNIIKHANASQVMISIKQAEDVLTLYIADNGKGFDIQQKRKGVGLYNIVNRTELFNGHVEIDSAPGKGCRMLVNFRIPPGN